jgi:hypothetical protein
MCIFPLFPEVSPEQWSAFGVGLTGWATLFLAIAAIFGLRQWRTQLIGTGKYEIARRLALLSLQFRDEFIQARNPMTFSFEYPDRPKGESDTNGEIQKINDQYYVRQKRLEPLRETLNKMKAASWEAEIILGEDIQQYITPFDDIFKELFSAILVYFSRRQTDAERTKFMRPEDGLRDMSQETKDETQKLWRIIYFSGSDDELNPKLDETVVLLKQYLQKFIRGN